MSLPHTGKLEVIVNGVRCHFDGDRWRTPDAQLTARLNEATDSSPKTHYTIDGLCEHILAKTRLLTASQILSFKSDQWTSEIPGDAVD